MERPRLISGAPLVLLLAVSGCGLFRSGEATPAPIRVRLSAAARLNPDEQGASLPTAVRVFQLTGQEKFQALELMDLLHDAKGALGDELLAVDDLQVEPGGQAQKTITRLKGARLVAVVAIVRRPAGGSWRQVVELPDGAADLAFGLEEYRLARR